jgi:membrane protease YdiL (CAAX protease family)
MAWPGASEWLIVRLGLAQADAWPPMTTVAMAARVGALVISGPAAEELVTRGLGLAVLTRRRGRRRWP